MTEQRPAQPTRTNGEERRGASFAKREAKTEVSPDVAWALPAITGSAANRSARLYASYYAGLQRLMIDNTRLRTIFGQLFARFRLNLCSAVVDGLADRLQVASFGNATEDAADDEDARLANDIWRANRMRRQQIEVHRAAIASGNSYVIVWTDMNGNPRLYPQDPQEIAVEYDAADPMKLTRAAKLWATTDPTSPDPLRPRRLWRLNIYKPEYTEKWAATGPELSNWGLTNEHLHPPDAKKFDPFVEEDGGLWPLLNPYGVVPVFHFPNAASALGAMGVSELQDAVPIQDWINYSVFSMLVGQEFQGFPQRYAIGVEVPIDDEGNAVNPFKAGPDRLWFADPRMDEDVDGNQRAAPVQMGQFAAANLDQLLNVKREAALSMAQATGTPPHHFMLPSGFVSGESQKTAESRLDTKVGDRQAGFGDVWASALALAVRMVRQGGPPSVASLGSGEVSALDPTDAFFEQGLDTNWHDLKPRNEVESWTVAEKKAKLGVSNAQILREQGYTEEQLASFVEEGGNVTLAKLPENTEKEVLLTDGRA